MRNDYDTYQKTVQVEPLQRLHSMRHHLARVAEKHPVRETRETARLNLVALDWALARIGTAT